MIASISVTGIGRLATRLDLPDGDCEILGESEAGKSLLVESICYAMFGRGSDGGAADVGLLTGERADVAIGFVWGDALRRPVTPKGVGGATLTVDGTEHRHASQTGLASALGPDLGGRARLCRLLMAPMAWTALPPSGKDSLAELVRSALPPSDLRAEVARLMADAGADLRPTDPIEEKPATEARRVANTERDRAQGRLEEARRKAAPAAAPIVAAPSAEAIDRAVAVLDARDAWLAYGSGADARARRDALRQVIERPAPAPVNPADVAEADAIDTARVAWERHDRANEQHRAVLARRVDAVARRDDVRARRSALGERPVADTAALRAKREQIARVDVRPFEAAAAEKAGVLATAEAAVKALAGKGRGCPTCGQEWAERAEAVAAAMHARDTARVESERTQAALDRTRASLAALQAEVAAIEQAETAGRTWDQRNRDIGPEPSVPVAPVAPVAPDMARLGAARVEWAANVREAVVEHSALTRRHAADVSAARAELDRLPVTEVPEPVTPCPSAEDVAAAEEVLRASAEADGVSAERERARADADRAVAAAERDVASTSAEADRLDVLVSACRRAPGAIAERESAALGDMGPASLRWTEAGGVEVLVDGRAWHRASTGRRILADLHFRAALARAAGLDWLTLFVDEAQSWSGAWPDVGVRQVRLRTAAGPLRVVSA